MSLNVFQILNKVYGARGIPFPNAPKQGEGTAIGKAGEYSSPAVNDKGAKGSLIRKYDDELLGTYQFLPATINGIDLPNAIVIISGEKEIVQTDIVDVGTVFEQVFIKPYDISIIVTLIGDKGNWPEDKLQAIHDLWMKDGTVTLKCALTDIFLQAKENFIIQKMSVMDNQGSENVEVIQIDGMSNIDFELEIL